MSHTEHAFHGPGCHSLEARHAAGAVPEKRRVHLLHGGGKFRQPGAVAGHPVSVQQGLLLVGFEVGGFLGLVFAIPTMAVLKVIVFSILFHKQEAQIFKNQKVIS